MPDLTLERDYALGPGFVFDAIVAGSLFAGAGADRPRLVVDARPGGGFRSCFGASEHDDVVTGVFTTVVAPTAAAPATIAFTWADGTAVTVMIDGAGEQSHVRLTHTGIPDGDLAEALDRRWSAALATLAPLVTDPRGNWEERLLLEDYLETYRRIVVWKVRDLSETDARRRIVPSLTTPLGLVKHLTGVERNWFQVHLAQRTRDDVGPNNRGSDESWDLAPSETVASVIAEYEAECARSRRVAAGFDLGDDVPDAQLGRLSLRNVYVHMIEETARHAGHADILRELIDGATGVIEG